MVMSIPAWVELRKGNYRVVVDQSYGTFRNMEALAKELNKLFAEHREWAGTTASVDCDEQQYCKLCNQKYIPSYDDERQEEVCEYCGGGKLEYALKKLKEAK